MQPYIILLLTTDGEVETEYQATLTQLGHAVHIVRTFSQAQKLLSQHHITHVLLDIGLNKRSRLDTLAQFRTLPEALPVIALTQSAEAVINHQAIQLGAQDYLVTGVHTTQDLQLALDKALVRHQQWLQLTQQLAQEAQSQSQRIALLNEITQTAVTDLDSDEMLPALLSKIAALFHADASYCLLWDDRNQRPHITAMYGKPLRNTYAQSAYIILTKVALQANQPTLINEPATVPYLHEKMAEQVTAKAILILPLIVDQQWLGAITLSFDNTKQLTTDDMLLGEQAARQVGLSLIKTQLWRETKKRATRMEMLYQISSDLRAASTIEMMLAAILKSAIYASRSICSIMLMPSDEGDLLKDDYFWPPTTTDEEMAHLQATQPVYILQQGRLVREDSANLRHLRDLNHHLALPLRTQDRLMGMLHVSIVNTKRSLLRPELGILTTLADIASSALYRVMVMETLEQRVQRRTHALAEANKRLQQMDNIRSKFIADMSHELRTPVTNFRLYLDLLENGRSERYSHYLGVLKHETQRLEQLIDETLNLSKLDAHEGQNIDEHVQLNELVTTVAANYLYNAETAGLLLDFEPTPQLPTIQGNPSQLLQAIEKLIDNAIRYTPQDGFVYLSTRIETNGRFISFCVQDTGIGIPLAEQEHLFKRFYRGTRTSQSNVPGAGLGLALVKQIAELHNGHITVESEVDKGSTFCLLLPLL